VNGAPNGLRTDEGQPVVLLHPAATTSPPLTVKEWSKPRVSAVVPSAYFHVELTVTAEEVAL